MTPWKALSQTVHLAALGVWLGVTLAAGAFAASVFPLMRELDPKLPAYAGYTGDHWLIAGGTVAQRIFLLTDIVQFVCAVLSVGTLGVYIWQHSEERRRPATIIRACALGLALACAAGSIIIVAPQLNAALKLHWAAARAGDMAAAMQHKSVVDQLHPIASKLMGGTIVCVFIAFIAGLWAASRGRSAGGEGAPEAPPSRYEEPALLRKRLGGRV